LAKVLALFIVYCGYSVGKIGSCHGEVRPPSGLSGIRNDTLFLSPQPLDDGFLGSFGYGLDNDRAMTRHAVSGKPPKET
jgi:hypothetical protein